MLTIESLTDAQLYQRCKQYGMNAREWTRKFAGLLPEVYRRRLHKRRGHASIHEFAAKLAGMSERKVDRILRLSRKLEDKPLLKEELESGGSWTKLEKIAPIATTENQETLIRKVKEMPQLVLEDYVRNIKNNRLEKVLKEQLDLKKESVNLSANALFSK